ncbi:hypothetical protein [Bradyrhizobium sp.]|jgi:hypothetical protein|uniref:hypothetical protein n=1 Tax=Bradyrhizobium sp. TaxID=376 RepID=UPI002DDD9CF4|nr:hypothetical protein [Bradyrhizobium sp.]HEV2155901.1 hypothetical protein [Bradyrhizobium sp.]
MASSQPLSIVVRIPDVALSRSELNAALGLEVDRYENSPGRAYAQIDIGDQWDAALACVQSVRAVILRLVAEGSIGAPSLDVAMVFPHSYVAKTFTIPADVAAIAGGAGMDVQLSVYKTE